MVPNSKKNVFYLVLIGASSIQIQLVKPGWGDPDKVGCVLPRNIPKKTKKSRIIISGGFTNQL
jgi:hypothetical protein